MERQPGKAQNQTQNEEDVLDFDLDDISLEDIDPQVPAQEQGIIELTDLVARGVPIEDKAIEAAPEPLKEGQPGGEEEGFILLEDDLVGFELAAETAAERKSSDEPDVTDFALELNLSEGQNDPPVAAKEAEEVVSIDELEEVLKAEALELIPEKEVASREKALEEIVSLSDLEDDVEQIQTDLPDVADLLKGAGPVKPPASLKVSGALDAVQGPISAAAPTPSAGPTVTGISEEKLEAIVTKVVQDVVERIARETMSSVAERVIGEAIESLKKSLSENTSEGGGKKPF